MLSLNSVFWQIIELASKAASERILSPITAVVSSHHQPTRTVGHRWPVRAALFDTETELQSLCPWVQIMCLSHHLVLLSHSRTSSSQCWPGGSHFLTVYHSPLLTRRGHVFIVCPLACVTYWLPQPCPSFRRVSPHTHTHPSRELILEDIDLISVMSLCACQVFLPWETFNL